MIKKALYSGGIAKCWKHQKLLVLWHNALGTCPAQVDQNERKKKCMGYSVDAMDGTCAVYPMSV